MIINSFPPTIYHVDVNSLNVSLDEIYRSMGYGTVIPDENIRGLVDELLDETKKICMPLFCIRIDESKFIDKELNTNGKSFEVGDIISKLMRKSEESAFFVATAGMEFQKKMDDVYKSDDILKAFILDSIGSVLVESVGDYMETCLEKIITPLKHTNRFSPGYCNWNISEQKKLFSLFVPNQTGVVLSDTCLMRPIKSISGVMGIGADVITKKYGCSICKNKNCYLRKKSL